MFSSHNNDDEMAMIRHILAQHPEAIEQSVQKAVEMCWFRRPPEERSVERVRSEILELLTAALEQIDDKGAQSGG